jgi:hypothetical protein
MTISIEFSDKEMRKYLRECGYSIVKTYYNETRMETDEFYGGTYIRTVEVAIKPGQKIIKKIYKLAVCGNTPSYPQEYTKVFDELISKKYKTILLGQ